jgi:hypothetical protein
VLAPGGRRRGRTLTAASSYLSPSHLPAAAGGHRRLKPARCRWRRALPYPLVRRLHGAAPAGSGSPRRVQFIQSDGDGRAWRRLPLAEASRRGVSGLHVLHLAFSQLEPVLKHPLVWVHKLTGAKAFCSSKRKPYFLLVAVRPRLWPGGPRSRPGGPRPWPGGPRWG